MKWFLQYFVAPLAAASAALVGNYWLVAKPQLNKDYTQMSVEILRDRDAPANLRIWAEDLASKNSPIPLSKSEQTERLDYLLTHIPVGFRPEEVTWRDIMATAKVYLSWSYEVQDLCPECVSEEYFEEEFEKAKMEFDEIQARKK